ncbi:MAG: DUF4145 domain-containing protein [Dehalococcoidia bacterium]|nr:DUF4145 domain-containing protein [Dehalococcoidia bacterium]
MTNTSEVRTRRFFCNDCGRQTWHALVWGDSKHFDAADYSDSTVEFADRWLEVWQCQGCEAPFLMVAWMTSEDSERDETFYPPRAVHRIKPKKYRGMSLSVGYIYEEAISAFNANCPLLCAAGLRALLEAICDDKEFRRRRTLETKIESLKKYVGASVADNLHSLRFMGNSALHRLEVPEAEDVTLGIDVMEDVMTAIYRLDDKSRRLFQKVTQARAPIPVLDEAE